MTNAWVAIGHTTLSTASNSVSFEPIPSNYRDLQIVVNGKRSTATGGVLVRANGDATISNYARVAMYGNGSAAYSFANDENEFVYMDNTDTVFRIDVMDYSATDKHKAFITRSDEPATWVFAIAGRWKNTDAITSIELVSSSGDFVVGTTFTLYGSNRL
jgi:hypothetical protein